MDSRSPLKYCLFKIALCFICSTVQLWKRINKCVFLNWNSDFCAALKICLHHFFLPTNFIKFCLLFCVFFSILVHLLLVQWPGGEKNSKNVFNEVKMNVSWIISNETLLHDMDKKWIPTKKCMAFDGYWCLTNVKWIISNWCKPCYSLREFHYVDRILWLFIHLFLCKKSFLNAFVEWSVHVNHEPLDYPHRFYHSIRVYNWVRISKENSISSNGFRN